MKIKWNLTTILGLITFVCTIILTFLDMILSTKEAYSFVLEAWHIFAGLGTGIALIVLPQDKLVEVIMNLSKRIGGNG